MYRYFIKRWMDIVLSLSVLIIFSPLLLVTAGLVKMKIGSPVIFKQNRPGKDGKIFTLYKFRTMTDERDAQGNILPDEKRLTQFGSFLRSTSVDELPEVFNILKSEMSFVGPRPLLTQYLPLYNKEQRRRHEVRPGLSGWAQVNGRNKISWEDRFKLDVWYVDNLSFWLDMKIIFMTCFKVFSRSDINSDHDATMEDFEGEVE